MSHKWAPFWLAVAGGMLLIASSKRDDGRPQPDPPRTVTQIDVLYANEADLMVVAHQMAIRKLQDGSLSTDQQTRDWLAEAMKEAHNQTWAIVGEQNAKAFADGWSAEKHVKRLQEMLSEVRR